MRNQERTSFVLSLIEKRGFLSVSELSELCQVSEMTIRRDLTQLEKQKKILRTFGGAAPLPVRDSGGEAETPSPGKTNGLLADRVDVLIATALNPSSAGLLLEIVGNKKNIPIIAESLSTQNEETIVAVDNFQAGFDLGLWAGVHARDHWGGKASVLDLTYYLSNTQIRSQAFMEGVRKILPEADLVLTVDAQSRYDTSYQLTLDALSVHKDINIIFAINDSTAWGAINACKEMGLDPEKVMVCPFGLEGDTLKNALIDGDFCKVGVSMYPEIVGPVCIEAAISAFNRRILPLQLVTPYSIVTSTTLLEIYSRLPNGHWELRWDYVKNRLPIPLSIDRGKVHSEENLPKRIGFIIPFSEHEWYKNLTASMQSYASHFKIGFEMVDVHQNLRDETDMRRRKIAHLAADLVQPGDVIMIDGGPIANYLAEELKASRSLTVITNSMEIFDILRGNPNITLISTGGAFRNSSQMLVGPTAESALRELRADKFFLMVTGITFNFGLSHTNISEVTMKQAMIRSAREVILLADHTFFGQESVIQVAPLTVANKLITDDALPASVRLELTKLGIQVLLASE